jgi:myosin-crossreactive antigen
MPQTDLKLVAFNQESMKKVSPAADPVANFLQMVNKLQFIVSLPPTLKKDARQIQVENFYRHNLFSGKTTNGAAIKNEMLKLNNCSREPILTNKDVRILWFHRYR